ncbi:MAG: hypothetical protein AABX69_03180, partial [Nanoarchaeota archaeon]
MVKAIVDYLRGKRRRAAGAPQPAQAPAPVAPVPLAPDLEGAVNDVLDGHLSAIGYIAQSGKDVLTIGQGAYGNVALSQQTSFGPQPNLLMRSNSKVSYEHAPMPIVTTEGDYDPQAWEAAAAASNQEDRDNLEATIVAGRAEITGAVNSNYDVDALRTLGSQQALAALVNNFRTIGRLGKMRVIFRPSELLDQLQKYVTVVQMLAEAGTGTPDYSVRDSLETLVQANNALATAANPVAVQLGQLTPGRAAA